MIRFRTVPEKLYCKAMRLAIFGCYFIGRIQVGNEAMSF